MNRHTFAILAANADPSALAALGIVSAQIWRALT